MNNIKKTVISAMLLAVGIALPFLTGQLQQIGNMLLPMHIPALLCGLICGWQYGLGIGFIMPLLRSFLCGMPMMYPNAVAMAFELAAYGFIIGFLYEKSRWQCIRALYRCMIIAMVGGRIVWGIAEMILLGVGENGFTFTMFMGGAFFNAIPGIILQLILVPAIMLALDKTHLVPFRGNKHHRRINADAE